MKRKLLIGLCILVVLAVGWLIMYHCTIQNVFDEMYYGHDGIFPYVLHPATYRQFGLRNIPDSMRYMLDDAIQEYAADGLMKKADGDVISMIWYTNQKTLALKHHTPIGNDEYYVKFDVEYGAKSNTLTIHPVRFTKIENHTPVPVDYQSLLHDYSHTKTDIEQIFYDGFLELLTNRWFEVNGTRSRFSPEDFGEITIENHLLDSIPE